MCHEDFNERRNARCQRGRAMTGHEDDAFLNQRPRALRNDTRYDADIVRFCNVEKHADIGKEVEDVDHPQRVEIGSKPRVHVQAALRKEFSRPGKQHGERQGGEQRWHYGSQP